MTYFSSAPVPPASLMDRHGQDISKRPSKLPPSERLHRPHQSSVSSQADNHASKLASSVGHSLPTSYSTGGDPALSLSGKSQLLPVPGILRPGGAFKHQAPRNPTSSELPSVLRPGDGKSPKPQSPNPARVVTPPRPYRQPPFNEFSSPNEFAIANPYLSALSAAPSFIPAVPPVRNDIVPSVDYSSPADIAASPAWDQSDLASSNLSFPEPVIPIVPEFHVQAESYQDIGCQHAAQARFSSPVNQYSSPRYQVPLPLPQDMGTDIRSSPPGSQLPEINSEVHLEAYREAKEDSAERHEQEQGDLALALELDRELNS